MPLHYLYFDQVKIRALFSDTIIHLYIGKSLFVSNRRPRRAFLLKFSHNLKNDCNDEEYFVVLIRSPKILENKQICSKKSGGHTQLFIFQKIIL